MAHVGVERLAARNGERDGSEHDEAGDRRGDEDVSCVRRVHGFKHARRTDDLHNSDYRDDSEP